MNYYLDFDNTLYETAKLTDLMLGAISKGISDSTGNDTNSLFQEAKGSFDSTNDNIFRFSENMSKRYGVNPEVVTGNINRVLDNGESLVFDDAKRFLERIKENGHKAYMLTYLPKGNQEYQMRKILGSGLTKYFDGLMLTTELKFKLDIDYPNGKFYDDDPRDLNGLYEAGAGEVTRIRKQNNKRSRIDINNPAIKEYESFDDIEVPKDKSLDNLR